MIQALQTRLKVRIRRWLKSNFPDGDTNAIASALQKIKQDTDQGRVYKRQILACYSKTKQAQMHEDFVAAIESISLEYQGRTQTTLFGQGGAA